MRDLRKVANSADTKFDEFVVTLWKNRLPQQVQQVLAISSETDVGKLATMADKIHEIRPARREIQQVGGTTDTLAGKEPNSLLETMFSKINDIQTQVN